MGTTTTTLVRRLHAALLEAQRLDVERQVGRLSSGQALQAMIHDPRFAWLHELTELAARLDTGEAGAGDVHALLSEPDPQTTFGTGYLAALQDHPDVVFAHRDVINATTPERTAA